MDDRDGMIRQRKLRAAALRADGRADEAERMLREPEAATDEPPEVAARTKRAKRTVVRRAK